MPEVPPEVGHGESVQRISPLRCTMSRRRRDLRVGNRSSHAVGPTSGGTCGAQSSNRAAENSAQKSKDPERTMTKQVKDAARIAKKKAEDAARAARKAVKDAARAAKKQAKGGAKKGKPA